MSLPIGAIIMWYKSIAEIPSGWQLCDGTNSTPDLRDKFVKGVALDTDKGVATGSATHAHTNQSTVAGGDHTHTIGVNVGAPIIYNHITSGGMVAASETHRHDFTATSSASGTHQHTTSNTAAGDSLPPFIQVYFIMKVA